MNDAVPQYEDSVGDRSRLEIVGHHDDAAISGRGGSKQLEDVGSRGCIERARRLICEDDVGTRREDARDRDALLLPSRQLSGKMPAAVGQTDGLQCAVDSCALHATARKAQRERDVLTRTERRDQVVLLEHEAHAFAAHGGQAPAAHPGDFLPRDANGPAVDRFEPREAVQERGLAGSARTDDGDHLASFDSEGHSTEYGYRRIAARRAREGLVQVGRGDERCHTSIASHGSAAEHPSRATIGVDPALLFGPTARRDSCCVRRLSTMRNAHVWHAVTRAPWRFLTSSWPWRSLVYLLTSAALGIVLVPITVITLLLVPLWAMAIGAIERRRTRILGFPPQASAHVRVTSQQRHTWLGVRLTEQATWREVGAYFVDLAIGWLSLIVLFFEAVVFIVGAAMAIVGRERTVELWLFFNVRIAVGPATWTLVLPALLAALVLFAYLNALLAGAHASLLRFLCGPREAELQLHVERLTRSRAVLVRAIEDERRRIERDLHDGVQQDLVAISARLGLVALELDDLAARASDVSRVTTALDEARTQTEHALAELRRTVRGIHPTVLTDRGLGAALTDLAERSPMDVRLAMMPFDRPARDVETAAYYVVSEAITNTAKHTTSKGTTVTAAVDGGYLDVEVVDQGHGGVDEGAGTGIRGLRERVETLGGSLLITSPIAGPTAVRLRIPVDASVSDGGDNRAHPHR